MSDSFEYNPDVSSKEATPKTRFASNVVDGNPNRSNSALILIDFQNEFCKLGGELYDDVKTMMESNDMLKKVPKVLGTARDTGALIIYSPVLMKAEENFQNEEYDPYSYQGMVGLFTEGTWNAEILEEVKPEPCDIILKNRQNFSAFNGTGLASILKENGITQVFITGFLTNVCIEETVREMATICPEITIHVLSDGCASKSEAEHNHSTTTVFPLFNAKCITCSGAQIALSSSTLQRKTHKENKESISESKLFRRPRILALAGAKSNGTVTRLQLENLHITEENYDIDYLQGQIETEEGDPELAGLVHGPFFSWLNLEKEKLGRSLIEAVQRVLTAVHVHGPYDGVYGFSTGGIVASLAADIVRDTALQEAIAKLESSKAGDVVFNFVRRLSSIIGVKATRNMSFDRRMSGFNQNLSHPAEFNLKKNAIQICHPCVRRNQGIKFSLPPKASRLA